MVITAWIACNIIFALEEILNYTVLIYPAERIKYAIEDSHILSAILLILMYPGLYLAYIICKFFYE